MALVVELVSPRRVAYTARRRIGDLSYHDR